ncbi:hypothetical protein ACWDYH_36045 [Nocardia goodfellowii]
MAKQRGALIFSSAPSLAPTPIQPKARRIMLWRKYINSWRERAPAQLRSTRDTRICMLSHHQFKAVAERVESTSSTLPRNIVAFDSTGHQLGSFYAGDAIAQLLTDSDGRIWISYFDEATFAFPEPDGTWATGFMIGLARWDALTSSPCFARFQRHWKPGGLALRSRSGVSENLCYRSGSESSAAGYRPSSNLNTYALRSFSRSVAR